jgi:hypothetical protein
MIMSRTVKRGKGLAENDLPEAVHELVKPFGWTCATSVMLLTRAEHELLTELMERLSSKKASTHAPITIPDCFWRIVLIGTNVLDCFANVNDAKALACFLMPSTARFMFWRNLAGESFNDTALGELLYESLMSLPAASPTCSGAVYQVRDETGHHIWFGRKVGQRPALSDKKILEAVRRLFSIGGE